VSGGGRREGGREGGRGDKYSETERTGTRDRHWTGQVSGEGRREGGRYKYIG